MTIFLLPRVDIRQKSSHLVMAIHSDKPCPTLAEQAAERFDKHEIREQNISECQKLFHKIQR